jgi:hypothetical protein
MAWPGGRHHLAIVAAGAGAGRLRRQEGFGRADRGGAPGRGQRLDIPCRGLPRDGRSDAVRPPGRAAPVRRRRAGPQAGAADRGERLDARGDFGPQHLARQERHGDWQAPGDHARVVDAETPPDQEQRGRGIGVDAGASVPAEQFRREVRDAGAEELEAAGGVLLGDLGDERLQGEFPIELIHPAKEPHELAVAAEAIPTLEIPANAP